MLFPQGLYDAVSFMLDFILMEHLIFHQNACYVLWCCDLCGTLFSKFKGMLLKDKISFYTISAHHTLPVYK